MSWTTVAAFRGQGLCAGYGDRQVLHGLDFELPADGISVLAGPGGSGKTTLLRVLRAQNEPPSDLWWSGTLRSPGAGEFLPQPVVPRPGSATPTPDPAARKAAVLTQIAAPSAILLLDEPADILETSEQAEICAALRARPRSTVVLATHHLGFIRQVADYVVLLVDGVIVEAAPATTFFGRPQEERTRDFLRWGS